MVVSACGLFLVCCIPLRPLSAQEVPNVFREAVSVDVETQVVKTLETAREHVIEGQWEPAVIILQELIDSHADTLVPAEPGRYANTGNYCHLLISQLPSAGLEAYRSRVDAQAREWFESGQKNLDESPLQRIVDSAFNSSFGDDALWLLGELAFERGQYALARQYWSLLVPSPPAGTSDVPGRQVQEEAPSQQFIYLTYPDPAVSIPEVLARLVLCSIFEGDGDRARRELTVFRQRFAVATGELAGRTGTFAEILSDVLAESENWSGDRRHSSVLVAPGGRPDRNAELKPEPRPERLLWKRRLPGNRFEGPASRPAMETERPSPCFPLVVDETVFVCGPDSVFAFDLATGNARWPIDEQGDARIYTNLLERPVMPHLPSAGVAWYTLCVSDGRLYARMGPPVVRRSRNEGNTFSEIVGLDIAEREGELAFHVTSDVLDPDAESPEATSWSFEGTPIVSGGRVYVSARRGFPEDEILVACFDADSSRLLWKRRVCASLRSPSDRFNLIGHNLLTLGDGRLYLSTGMGAIAALDTSDGRLIWMVTYQSNDDETTHELSDTRRHGLTPCVFYRGIVYVAPGDSKLLLALDATTGRPVWRQSCPDQILQMAGVADGRLILCGQSVWAVDTGTGQPAWPEKVGFADPAGRGYGHPALSHDFLYWPTRDEILRIDHRSGRVAGRILLRQDYGQSGGNLVIADGRLLIAQPDGLVALGTAAASGTPDANPPVEPEPPPATRLGVERAGSLRRPSRLPENDARFSAVNRIKGQGFTDSSEVTPAVQISRQASRPMDTVSSRSQGNTEGFTPATASVPFWPTQRSWQMSLSADAVVRFPSTAVTTPAVGPVVIRGSSLDVLEPGSGKVRWSASVSHAVNHVAASQNTLALVTPAGIIARSLDDGRLLWRRLLKSRESASAQLRSEDHSSRFLLMTEAQVAAIDADSGDEVWVWPVEPRGKSARSAAASRYPTDWVLASERILYRRAGSATHALFEVSSGKLLHRGILPFAASTLIEFPDPGTESQTVIAGLDTDSQVRMAQLAEPGIHWVHRTTGRTHGSPEILSDNSVLVICEDQQFAVRLHIESGQQMWRRPVSPGPLSSSSNCVVLRSPDLFCISDGVVRAFSVDDGRLKWQRYVGSEAGTLRVSGDVLICLQDADQQSGHDPDSQPSSMVILDTEDGRVVQRLRFLTTISSADLAVQSHHCFVRAGNQLIGLEPWRAF